MPMTVPHTSNLQPTQLRDPSKVLWYTPQGWTTITAEQAAVRRARIHEEFTAKARAHWVDWLARKAPTRWPKKHRPLLDYLRARAQDDGLRWTWNNAKKEVAGVRAGALLIRRADGTEAEFDSLDAAADALCPAAMGATKRTGKAELVAFLSSIARDLPDHRRAEADRLLEAA